MRRSIYRKVLARPPTDRTGRLREEANGDAVVRIGDDDVAGPVEGDGLRVGELCARGGVSVARVVPLLPPGDGVDVPRDHGTSEVGARCVRHISDDVVARVSDHDAARGVDGNAGGSVELGACRRYAAAGVTGRPVARDRVDVVGGHGAAEVGARGGGDEADDVVAGIRDGEIAEQGQLNQ